MPLVQIFMRRGKPAAHVRAIRDGVYRAMRETFNVPDKDRFMVVTPLDADDFDVSPDYLDIARSADAVIVQITANNTRGVEQKKALFAAIAANLHADPGLRTEDVMIVLVEVARENWSFGLGVAQYA